MEQGQLFTKILAAVSLARHGKRYERHASIKKRGRAAFFGAEKCCLFHLGFFAQLFLEGGEFLLLHLLGNLRLDFLE